MENNMGRVYLVGAGCGEADLITLRGLRLLQRCDALVYDDLIAPELLSAAPKTAERIYMGKRSGCHSASQQEINEKLTELGLQGKTVVRLKGGDPFVFGRGGEELQALTEAGVLCEEVPGISSAIAIPAAAGIPVTHRGMSQSVHIVTAHTADTEDGLPAYLDALAGLPGTLVFLMGLSRLDKLAERLISAGAPAERPAAVISGGNSPNPVTVRGTLADIGEKTAAAGARAPAVIVVGETAALSLVSTVPHPLDGITVALTGTERMTDKLAGLLREQGARTYVAQRTETVPLPFAEELKALTDGRTHWLVFTSPNGVSVFFDALRRERTDVRSLHNCRFAVIGSGTAKALEAYGVYPALCPDTYTTEALGEALAAQLKDGEDVRLFRSRHGSPVLAEKLSEHAAVHDIPTYEVRSTEAEEPRPAQCTVFCSAGGVEAFFAAGAKLWEETVCLCIGEVTAAALKKHTSAPVLTSEKATAECLVQRLVQWAEESR